MRCNLHDYDIMEDGIRQGKEEGKLQAKIEAARNFLMEKLPEETIARCTGLPLETVQQLAEELKVPAEQ